MNFEKIQKRVVTAVYRKKGLDKGGRADISDISDT